MLSYYRTIPHQEPSINHRTPSNRPIVPRTTSTLARSQKKKKKKKKKKNKKKKSQKVTPREYSVGEVRAWQRRCRACGERHGKPRGHTWNNPGSHRFSGRSSGLARAAPRPMSRGSRQRATAWFVGHVSTHFYLFLYLFRADRRATRPHTAARKASQRLRGWDSAGDTATAKDPAAFMEPFCSANRGKYRACNFSQRLSPLWNGGSFCFLDRAALWKRDDCSNWSDDVHSLIVRRLTRIYPPGVFSVKFWFMALIWFHIFWSDVCILCYIWVIFIYFTIT